MTRSDPIAGDPAADEDDLSRRLAEVHRRVTAAAVAAGRDPSAVRLLLATKTQPPERILAAFAAGFRLIGENRVQEVTGKADALAAETHETHFIGHLQANKVAALLPHVSCLQTVDSVALADRLQRRLEVLDRRLDVLVQVNVSGETTKSGVAPDEAAALLRQLRALDRLSTRGLMTIGRNTEDRSAVLAGYLGLAGLAGRLREGGALDESATELSMGMSGDFEAAVTAGATVVRIGSAVFGQRRN